MSTYKTPTINPALAFQFLGVQDCGPCDGGRGSGNCPHCGAEGRYIYVWAEHGTIRGAMAGCYKALTGKLDKDAESKFFEVLAAKQAKNKPLNSWQKTAVRMLDFIQQGKYTPDWCMSKIKEAIVAQNRFTAQKWGGK